MTSGDTRDTSELRVELRFATLPQPLSLIAVHCWFVVVDGVRADRWEVWQDPDRGGESWRHLHRNMLPPDRGVGGGPARLDRAWRGEAALRLLHVLEDPLRYPFRERYRAWPGPNSNTYAAWVLREANVEHRLDPRAIGRTYLPALRGRSPRASGWLTSFGRLRPGG